MSVYISLSSDFVATDHYVALKAILEIIQRGQDLSTFPPALPSTPLLCLCLPARRLSSPRPLPLQLPLPLPSFLLVSCSFLSLSCFFVTINTKRNHPPLPPTSIVLYSTALNHSRTHFSHLFMFQISCSASTNKVRKLKTFRFKEERKAWACFFCLFQVIIPSNPNPKRERKTTLDHLQYLSSGKPPWN